MVRAVCLLYAVLLFHTRWIPVHFILFLLSKTVPTLFVYKFYCIHSSFLMCLTLHTPRFQPSIQPPRAAALPFSAGDFSAVRICGDVENFLAGSWVWNGKEEMGGVPALFLLFGEGEKLFFPTFSSSTLPSPSPTMLCSFLKVLFWSLRKTYVWVRMWLGGVDA